MHAKQWQPLGNRVLVKRSEAPTVKGGILLPDSAKEKPRQGEVLSVGPGKKDKDGKWKDTSVQVGDKVLFSTYAGVTLNTEDQDGEYLILSEDDILCVLQ